MSDFEPTEAQDGVDENWFTLINPDAIPYPETDVWSLNYAAESIKSGGAAISTDADGMHATWQLLGLHYDAPETDRLMASMKPVVTRGDDLEGDLAVVAQALEELAEAAKSARFTLNSLRIQAQAFHNKHSGNEMWWADVDLDDYELALEENYRLKTEVNQAWSTFTQAENACATKVSALFDGHAYVSPDEATGSSREIVYGLPTYAGQRDMNLGVNRGTARTILNEATAWAGEHYDPAKVEFENKAGQALYDAAVVNFLWSGAVGVANKSGVWTSEYGWALSERDRDINKAIHTHEMVKDALGMVGLYGQGGALYRPYDPDEDYSGSRWGEWKDNLKHNWGEAWEGFSGWSHHETAPEYTATTTAVNTGLSFIGLPAKLGGAFLNLGSSSPGNGGGSGSSPERNGSYSDPSPNTPTLPDSMTRPGARGPNSRGIEDGPFPDTLAEATTPTTTRHDDLIADIDIPSFSPDRTPEAPGPSPQDNGPSTPTTRPQDEAAPTPRPQNDTPSTPAPRPQNDAPSPAPRSNEDSAGNEAPQGDRTGDTPRTGEQSSADGPRTDRERQDSDQDRDREDRTREDGDSQAANGRGDNESNESRSENSSDRQTRSDDDQTVPPRTGDRGTEDGTSTTSNNSNNESTGGTGNTSEDSTSNSNQQSSGGEGNNGGGSSGNGGGDGGSPGDPSTGGTGDGEPYRSPHPGTPEYESRLQELMDDPASGPANNDFKKAAARREAEVGLTAERQGLIKAPIRRAEMDYSNPERVLDRGDFTDADGQPWDVKGFRDVIPRGPMAGQPTTGRSAFTTAKAEKDIRGELKKGENVLIDINALSIPENRSALEELVQNNPEWIGKVLIVYV